MKIYIVYRHYCNPKKVIIFAKTKKQAKLRSNMKFGYSDTTVKLLSKRHEFMSLN